MEQKLEMSYLEREVFDRWVDEWRNKGKGDTTEVSGT